MLPPRRRGLDLGEQARPSKPRLLRLSLPRRQDVTAR
jgi:hypothetical protein